MPSVNISGANTSAQAIFETNEAYPSAQALANNLSTGLQNGTLTPLSYTGGTVAPAPRAGANGVVVFATTPATAVTIPATDVGVFIAGGPTTITGGGPGETVIEGSSGLTYTNITPSGSAGDYITVGDGANLISTLPNTTGNYTVTTGAGNDTVSISGNGLISAGTGQNSISVTGGSSYIYSEGQDAITGSTVVGSGGIDTVESSTGQPTINPGTSNFVITEDTGATHPLLFNPGTGSDTITVGAGGGTVTGGSGGNNFLIAAAGVLYGTAKGDQLYATGSAPVTLIAGAGVETLSGAGGTLNGVAFAASTGNDTFIVGSGNDTIIGGSGSDTVDFAGLRAFYSIAAGPGGTLVVTDNVGGYSGVDTLSGVEVLAFADVTQAACYCRGTAIATEAGETPVEALRIGDTVMTAEGKRRPIKWVGYRSYARRFLAANLNAQPIRFQAASLGNGLPGVPVAADPKVRLSKTRQPNSLAFLTSALNLRLMHVADDLTKV